MHDFSYQAVLFDLDGVVLDSMEQHAAAWLRVMGAAGLRVEREFVLAHEGCLHTEVLEKLLAEHAVILPPGQGAPEFMLRLLDEQRRLYLDEFAHLGLPLFPEPPGCWQPWLPERCPPPWSPAPAGIRWKVAFPMSCCVDSPR